MLLADLMGVKVDGGRLNEIYTRREANRRELEESRSILQRAEAQLTAMVDQENARLAAISRAKLQTIGDEIAAMEAEYVKKIAEFGDFFEAMLAKRMEYRQADSEFGRYSPNRGSGLQGPRPTLFAIPERYLHGSTFGLPTLREQIQRWAREPEERREASRREHEVYALRVGELREQERIAQERAERLAQQGDTYRYP